MNWPSGSRTGQCSQLGQNIYMQNNWNSDIASSVGIFDSLDVCSWMQTHGNFFWHPRSLEVEFSSLWVRSGHTSCRNSKLYQHKISLINQDVAQNMFDQPRCKLSITCAKQWTFTAHYSAYVQSYSNTPVADLGWGGQLGQLPPLFFSTAILFSTRSVDSLK